MGKKNGKSLSHDERYDRRQKIAKAIKAGRSVAEVCSQFRISCETVRRALAESGMSTAGATGNA